MEINLPFDSSEQTMDLIKLAALYYDRVNVVCPEDDSFQLYDQKLLLPLVPLEMNRVIEKTALNLQSSMAQFTVFLEDRNTGREILRTFIRGMLDSDGFINSLTWMLSQVRGSEDFAQLLGRYFLSQLLAVYIPILNKQACISNNASVLSAITQLLQRSDMQLFQFSKSLQDLMVINNTPILLPNFSNLSSEDILEMRLRANDELQELRCYLSELSSKYDAEDKQLTGAKDFIERDIKRAIQQFENKTKGLRKETIQRALKSMANPLSYAPMLTTFIKEAPVWVAAGVSMGIITAEAAVEYSKQKDKLKEDPLYFTVKLNKYGKGKGKKP